MPPKGKRKKEKRNCALYQKLQRSVKRSFLCTGGEFWEPCSKFEACLKLETVNGVPPPWDPEAKTEAA
jgi:hypothetical protein